MPGLFPVQASSFLHASTAKDVTQPYMLKFSTHIFADPRVAGGGAHLCNKRGHIYLTHCSSCG